MKMTEQEIKLKGLYKKLLAAKKSYEEGKQNKDYLAVIYDLKIQINELTNNSITDGVVRFKTIKANNNIVKHSVIEIASEEEEGQITIHTKDKEASVSYIFKEGAHERGLDLRALKLMCEHLKTKGIETITSAIDKENIESNNLMNSIGAKKKLMGITPYNEYTKKLK